MKHTKKLFAIALTLIMALALTVPAFAASITINPNVPEDGSSTNTETFEAYKIFDATFEGDALAEDANVAYTIDADSVFLAAVRGFKVGEGDDAEAAFTLTLAADGTKYIVEANDCYTAEAAADLAVALKAVVDGDDTIEADKTVDSITGDSYVLSGLDKGYYFITSTLGSKIIVETLGTASVNTKNLYPTLTKKIVDADARVDSITAEYGDEITFEITVNIPATVDKDIVVHDTLDEDMTFAELTETAGVSVLAECDDAECEGNVHFTVDYDAVAKDDDGNAVFQYVATLNGNVATATAHPNTAWLTYSEFTSVEDTVNVYTYQIDVFKYTEGADGAKTGLAGAGFVLKNEDGEYYFKDETTGVVTWVEDIEAASEYVTAAETYTITFDGLMNGDYIIVEKTVPTGYNPLDEDIDATIADANLTGARDAQGTQVEVLNQTGTELPSTGGIGTTIFYVVGGLLMAGAGILLVTKKRMADEE